VIVRVSSSVATAETPVSLTVSERVWKKRQKLPRGTVVVPCVCQTTPAGQGERRVTFLCPALGPGEKKILALSVGKALDVQVRAAGKSAEFLLQGQFFTRYDVATGPNKPYFYPIQAFGGKHLTRRWPLETVPGEEKDHPHHRGLWFTHGAMNGVDLWTEGAGTGKTVHTGFQERHRGQVQGELSATSDWIGPDGKTIATDTRLFTVTPLSNGGILLDFTITLTALGGPLRWGDTKEGTFALRVPESMRADKPGGGTLVNAEGLSGAALWGKKSAWNDYFGPVQGETLGIAIFDHPENLRFPTTWHSRTYGLFAANPFGLHDFDPTKKTPPGAGDLLTSEGKSVTFRYRVYFHKGDTSAADVAGHFAAWATQPTVELAK
jgi:hypothetical protein